MILFGLCSFAAFLVCLRAWLGARVTPIPDGENLTTLRRVLESETSFLDDLARDIPIGPNTDLTDEGLRIRNRADHLRWLLGRIEKGRRIHWRDFIG